MPLYTGPPVPLGLHTASVLETSGPFARQQAAAQPADGAKGVIGVAGSGCAASPCQVGSEHAAALPADVIDSAVLQTVGLSFSYPGIGAPYHNLFAGDLHTLADCWVDGRPLPGVPPVVQDMGIELPRGARCLLIGPNGAGKTTLLKVLGGKHMVAEGAVRVLGASPFHDTTLAASGRLSYLGGNWDRDIAFAGYSIPLQGDFPARRMIDSVAGVDPARRARLMQVLDIDPEWRMHRVSDGQRRRVQICLGLLHPFQVLLLDEITVDLDVLGRADLLAFLREECEQRGAAIIYATHIFDGLECWPTHVAFLAGGRLERLQRAQDIPELAQDRLLELVERWLREELARRKAATAQAGGDASARGKPEAATWSNGWAAGRMTSTLRDASNAVMRM